MVCSNKIGTEQRKAFKRCKRTQTVIRLRRDRCQGGQREKLCFMAERKSNIYLTASTRARPFLPLKGLLPAYNDADMLFYASAHTASIIMCLCTTHSSGLDYLVQGLFVFVHGHSS